MHSDDDTSDGVSASRCPDSPDSTLLFQQLLDGQKRMLEILTRQQSEIFLLRNQLADLSGQVGRPESSAERRKRLEPQAILHAQRMYREGVRPSRLAIASFVGVAESTLRTWDTFETELVMLNGLHRGILPGATKKEDDDVEESD